MLSLIEREETDPEGEEYEKGERLNRSGGLLPIEAPPMNQQWRCNSQDELEVLREDQRGPDADEKTSQCPPERELTVKTG